MTLESLALQGRTKTYSTLAASVTSRIYELRKELIKESFSDTQQTEHKMEPVANVHGIEFINDSRACTINSAWFALESMTNPVIWITGPDNHDTNYSVLKELVAEKVKAVICLGKQNPEILEAFSDIEVPVLRAVDMNEAIEIGYFFGEKGDVVLLSPGCASFDMYENYEKRGTAFKEAVKKL